MFLIFKGKIVSGQGDHSKMKIPGKNDLSNVPDDWPEKLYPGSLNVLIDLDKVPEQLEKLGPGNGIRRLDNGLFKPAFMIEQALIQGNTIGPVGCLREGRGDAQIWRTEITLVKTGNDYSCWTLRRLDSGMWKHIELVSDECLRKKMQVEDEGEVIVSLEGGLVDLC